MSSRRNNKVGLFEVVMMAFLFTKQTYPSVYIINTLIIKKKTSHSSSRAI